MVVKVFIVSGFKKIVAKVKSSNTDSYDIEDPLMLEEMMTEQGPRAMIVPIPYAKQNQPLVLLRSALIFEPFDPENNLYNAYIETVTGLHVPSVGAGGIIRP